MERREYTRFRAQDDAYAVLGGDFSNVSKVYDISLNGLAFIYPEDKISNDNSFSHVDIFLSNNGFYLSGVPCAIVYDANESTSDSNGNSPYRCGLKFETLEAEHEKKLTYFLNHHVIEEGLKNRRQNSEDRSQGEEEGRRGKRDEGRRTTKGGGQRSEVGGQRSEVGGQRAKDRSQKTENRIQNPESRSKKTPVKSSSGGLPRAAFNGAPTNRDFRYAPTSRRRKADEEGNISRNKPSKLFRHQVLIGLIDFLLLNVALVGVQLFKRGNLELSSLYIKLFAVFYLAWLGTSMAMEKFKQVTEKTFFEYLALIVTSNIVMVYLVSFSIVLWVHLSAASRMQTFGVCGALFLLEFLGLIVGYIVFKDRFAKNRTSDQIKTTSTSTYYPLILIDAVMLMAVFLVINHIKRNSFALPDRYDEVILVLYALLFTGSFFVKKYDKNNFDSTYLRAVTPCIKATLIISGSLAMIVFAFRLFYYSRVHLFGSFAVLFVLELMVYYLYHAYRKYGKLDKDIETADEIMEALNVEDPYQGSHLPKECAAGPVEEPVEIKLHNALEFFSEALFHFIKKNVDLSKIERKQTAILSTDDIEEVKRLDKNCQKLFINLHKSNDVRWFNRYFLEVYGNLKNRGYFVGKAHTIGTRKKHYMTRYPRRVAQLFYYANFVWCRVFPKLPYIKKLYFTATRGRNRMVSKAEIFGRLYFCGFRIIDELEIENRLFFIAQKVKKPSLNKNPSYGPIVRLQRSGFNGNMITVYKFRTMYPYSEFLQEYIYRKNHLDEGGKFRDDFRVTDWGRFMRAVWLDELPMIYNWLKGDLKLFGVRPLSKQYLSLYTKELKELRKKVVPGLIPPFYADLPETLQEIMESEQRYIEAYLKKPIKTQAKYTWKSSKNILFNGVRSQ